MRRELAGMMRNMAVLCVGAFMLAGCTTAELAIDMVKKSQKERKAVNQAEELAAGTCLLYTSPSPRDRQKCRIA